MNGDARLPLLIEALGAIDVELARIHYALREISAWPSEPSEPTARARSALRRGFATVRMMRQLMVRPTSDSHENRASSLRARGIVVMLRSKTLASMC